MKVNNVGPEPSHQEFGLGDLIPREDHSRRSADRRGQFRVSRHEDFDVVVRAQQLKLLRDVPILSPRHPVGAMRH